MKTHEYWVSSYRAVLPASIAVIVLLAQAISTQAQFTFTTNTGAITITGYTGSDGAMIIPDTINGLPVTGIRWNAFENSPILTSVMIGANVTTIGIAAFDSCTNLSAITVDALNPVYSSVDGVLFDKSQTLLVVCPAGKSGSYTVPNSVSGIESVAFFGCVGLTNVTIGTNVSSVGVWAFASCPNLITIAVDALNSSFSSVDGILFNKTQTVLIECPGGKTGSYTISDSVTDMEIQAFDSCAQLTSVTVGNNVMLIREGVFERCSSLTNVTIPNGVTSIGSQAFGQCASLTNITIPNSVTNIGGWVFVGCTSLTSITIPQNVTSMGDGVFESCFSLSTITVDALNAFYSSADGVLFNKNRTVLIECPGGKVGSYAVPNSVTSIRHRAFLNCISLASVTIPDGVINIGDDAFTLCTNLASVTIPNSVTNIGEGAFYYCLSLASVTIGNGVTSIGDAAFADCTSLTGAIIPNSVINIGEAAFNNCASLASVMIGNSVANIGDAAFAYCGTLTNVTIPSSVTNIEDFAFYGCTSLKTIAVDAFNNFYCSVDGVLFDKSQTRLLQYPGGKVGSYAIPDAVSNIAFGAFSFCSGLASVVTGDGVTNIDSEVFLFCSGLASVTVGTNVTNIGDWAFYGATNLAGVYFRGNAPSVGSDVFSGDNSVTIFYLPGTTGWGATFGGLPTTLWLPQILTADASFGVRTNQFGFNITWASGMVVVVEACTNLSNPAWSPLQTNTLASNPVYFSDPNWTNYPGRFYRLRWP